MFSQVVSPMALFFLSPAKSYLFPIAIQLFQERGDNNPVSNSSRISLLIAQVRIFLLQN